MATTTDPAHKPVAVDVDAEGLSALRAVFGLKGRVLVDERILRQAMPIPEWWDDPEKRSITLSALVAGVAMVRDDLTQSLLDPHDPGVAGFGLIVPSFISLLPGAESELEYVGVSVRLDHVDGEPAFILSPENDAEAHEDAAV